MKNEEQRGEQQLLEQNDDREESQEVELRVTDSEMTAQRGSLQMQDNVEQEE